MAAAVDALREAGDVLAQSAPRSAALRYRQAIEYLPDGGDGRATCTCAWPAPASSR